MLFLVIFYFEQLLNIDNQEFEVVEIGEITSHGKVLSYPLTQMIRVYNKIIIQFNLSYTTKEEKEELLEIIHRSKFEKR